MVSTFYLSIWNFDDNYLSSNTLGLLEKLPVNDAICNKWEAMLHNCDYLMSDVYIQSSFCKIGVNVTYFYVLNQVNY